MNWFPKHRERGEPIWLWIFAAIGGLALIVLVALGGWQLWSLRSSGNLALGAATATTQSVPTFTATPDGPGAAQAASLEAGATPDPFDTEAVAGESGAIQA